MVTARVHLGREAPKTVNKQIEASVSHFRRHKKDLLCWQLEHAGN
jgi:hypothetical protein